jgi:hypothetical protein
MRKMPLVLIALIVGGMIGSATPMLVQGQARAGAAAVAPPAPGADDMARRTIRAFAPFLRALVSRRYNQAQGIFKIRRSVQAYLEQEEPTRIMSRFIRPDRFDLNLVGGRTLGQNIGILLFTIAAEDGPVAIKIYYYGYGNDINVSRIDVSDDWDEIELLSSTVEVLQVPVTVPLTAGPE